MNEKFMKNVKLQEKNKYNKLYLEQEIETYPQNRDLIGTNFWHFWQKVPIMDYG